MPQLPFRILLGLIIFYITKEIFNSIESYNFLVAFLGGAISAYGIATAD